MAAPVAVPPGVRSLLGDDERERLPNLIGIGAAKCGTSALHAYLADHPEIEAAALKELKLFGGARWVERLPWYAAQFAGSRPVRTETSPSYAMDPVVPGVPEQMAAVVPGARLIYMVGDPVKRAVAQYNEHRSLLFERRSLDEAFADAEEPGSLYLAASRYAHQLRRFLEFFPAERILVVDQADLRDRRRETLRTIYAFAGVDPGHWSPALETLANVSSAKIMPNRVGRAVLDWTHASPRGKRLATIPRLTAGPLRPVVPDPALLDRIAAAVRDDVADFRRLTGRPFADWPV